jgi:hypothetical protein
MAEVINLLTSFKQDKKGGTSPSRELLQGE